jgi:hypothetical protein
MEEEDISKDSLLMASKYHSLLCTTNLNLDMEQLLEVMEHHKAMAYQT